MVKLLFKIFICHDAARRAELSATAELLVTTLVSVVPKI